jgi:probable F420-dependent oxidoreductase
VTGSLFATLNDSYGDRTICGIGRGDSAIRVLGHTPAKLATLSEAMKVIKGLAQGEEVTYNGTQQQIPWAKPSTLPMLMAAYGPKALHLCGSETDGFILQLADLQIAKWTIEAVKTAASDAGRDPDSLYICVAAPAYVGEDIEHQRNQVRWFGGMVGNHVADLVERYGGESEMVPQTLTDYIKGREGYDYSGHGKAGHDHTDFVPDEIIDRFCILGTEDQHIERLEALRELGVDQFAVYLMHDQKDETLNAYGQRVIPHLK